MKTRLLNIVEFLNSNCQLSLFSRHIPRHGCARKGTRSNLSHKGNLKYCQRNRNTLTAIHCVGRIKLWEGATRSTTGEGIPKKMSEPTAAGRMDPDANGHQEPKINNKRLQALLDEDPHLLIDRSTTLVLSMMRDFSFRLHQLHQPAPFK